MCVLDSLCVCVLVLDRMCVFVCQLAHILDSVSVCVCIPEFRGLLMGSGEEEVWRRRGHVGGGPLLQRVTPQARSATEE